MDNRDEEKHMRIIEKNVILGIPVLCCYTASKEPKPLVLLSHWFSGDKAVWEDKLEQLAEAGYYVVAWEDLLP